MLFGALSVDHLANTFCQLQAAKRLGDNIDRLFIYLMFGENSFAVT